MSDHSIHHPHDAHDALHGHTHGDEPGVHYSLKDYTTGFVLAELGRLPVTGDGFSYDGWHFEVVDMDGRRIDKLLVRREAPDAQLA